MRRPELVAALERLGRTSPPPPDEAKVAGWQHQLLHELPALGLLDVTTANRPRPHRQGAAVGAVVLAAAASVTALVVHHSGRHGAELQAVSGAVIVLPDGSRERLHAGDSLPPGGIVETGPDGRLTVRGVTVGPNQVGLVDDGGVTPLPAGATLPRAATAAPTTVTAAPVSSTTLTAPSSAATTAPTASRPVTAPPPSAVPSRRPVASATTPTPSPAGPLPTDPTTTPPPAATSPAVVAPVSQLLALSVAPAGEGVRLAWSQTQLPGSASAFGRYVVIRAALSLSLPKVIGVFPSQATTSFTDAAPPRGVRLYYRVLALDAANHLLALSPAVPIELHAAAPLTSAPPSTMTAQTTAPSAPRRGPGGRPRPVASTSTCGPSAPAPSMPSTSAAAHRPQPPRRPR